MSNIEKIKAEIERQLEYFKGKEDDAWDDCDKYTDEDAQWYQGHWKMCSRLLDFIDSLPEVKPSRDLEEAAEELFETIEIQEHENIFEDTFKKIFIAGAEWQKEQDVRDMYMSDNRNFLKCYEQGKKDMKQQMMKDAVEGEVENSCFEIVYLRKNLMNEGYSTGDKVRIIIVKNEE